MTCVDSRRLRRLADLLRRTPFHPQWLMPARKLESELLNCQGWILDIGSASRWLEAEVSERARYVALDYPMTALGLYGTRPDVFGDASVLPFADASIDAVACFEVMEHVRHPERVLDEIARVLKPGGSAYFSMPFLYPVHDAPHDYQRWTVHGWEHMLGKKGFSEVVVTRSGHSLHVAAVLATLALAGPISTGSRLSLVWRIPVAASLILAVNLSAWLVARFWPDWNAMGLTHHVFVRRARLE